MGLGKAYSMKCETSFCLCVMSLRVKCETSFCLSVMSLRLKCAIFFCLCHVTKSKV